MLRTHIPVSVWEAEGSEVIETAWRLLTKSDADAADDEGG